MILRTIRPFYGHSRHFVIFSIHAFRVKGRDGGFPHGVHGAGAVKDLGDFSEVWIHNTHILSERMGQWQGDKLTFSVNYH